LPNNDTRARLKPSRDVVLETGPLTAGCRL